MDLKHLKTKITYTIEPNPPGGFIARSADPSIPSIEAATAEELQKKIQAELMGSIGALLPGSNLPMMLAKIAAAGAQTASSTVTLNTSNGASVISKEATPEERKEFAKRIAGIVQKDFPELAQELSAKAENVIPSNSAAQGGIQEIGMPTASVANAGRGAFTNDAANRPILPETNSAWKLMAIFAGAVALALAFLMYAHR